MKANVSKNYGTPDVFKMDDVINLFQSTMRFW